MRNIKHSNALTLSLFSLLTFIQYNTKTQKQKKKILRFLFPIKILYDVASGYYFYTFFALMKLGIFCLFASDDRLAK
jgi:hypothetical protein